MKSTIETEVCVNYHYGAYTLAFNKTFNLLVAPFFGMSLFEEHKGYENRVDLITDDYQRTTIMYMTKEDNMYVDVRHSWKMPISEDRLDELIKNFARFGWKRTDDENIKQLKEIMKRNQ